MFLAHTKFELIKNGINILESSRYYESLSWPDQKKPKFLNIVLKVNSKLTIIKLLKICKKIQIYLGRKKSKKNSPRKCDIDILDFRNEILNGEIIAPHPRMHVRNFVLFPLFEINKDWIHPASKCHIKKLILLLSNSDIRSIKQI